MTTSKIPPSPLKREFRDPRLLVQSLTHRSFHNENPDESVGHNERLEFLGDAVLDLALSDLLMREFPDLSEGDLSKFRASLVNEAELADIAKELDFDRHIRLGKGELSTGGAKKPRLLASVLEAYIGALYLDQGFPEAFEFMRDIFVPRFEKLTSEKHDRDFKTRLQERAQEQRRQTPVYELVEESGPDHHKTFVVAVLVGDQELARGRGRSKKQAEQEAAKAALEGWS
jgi:ribonuclease III